MIALDVGNSYIKYKCWRADGRVETAAYVNDGKLHELLARLKQLEPKKIAIASVAAADFLPVFNREFPDSIVVPVVTSSVCLGVTNCYAEVERLGVDRWAAAIEAYHLSGRRACCVFDFGTAATFDVVSEDGMHLGGHIVPGLAMSRASLLQSTKSVRYTQDEVGVMQSVEAVGLGQSTADAVELGTWSMLCAWYEQEAKRFLQANNEGLIYVTGGVSPLFRHASSLSIRFLPDLVLDGVRRIAFG